MPLLDHFHPPLSMERPWEGIHSTWVSTIATQLNQAQLYAVAYRPTQAADAQRLEVWPEALAVGAALPTMPLWLNETLCLPLALEESYRATCAALRIRV